MFITHPLIFNTENNILQQNVFRNYIQFSFMDYISFLLIVNCYLAYCHIKCNTLLRKQTFNKKNQIQSIDKMDYQYLYYQNDQIDLVDK